MATNKDGIREELKAIAAKHRGLLRPHDVVAFAKNKRTALHKQFTWDDTKAAHEYRLWQAREVISVHVTVYGPDEIPFRAFVSLKEDRKQDGGGYRTTESVMSNSEWRLQLLTEAVSDFERLQTKYAVLKELEKLFAEIGNVKKVVARRQKRNVSRKK